MRIYFYETPGGNAPIKKFIDDLPKADQARFLEVIDEIELNGLSASRIIFKPLEGKYGRSSLIRLHLVIELCML